MTFHTTIMTLFPEMFPGPLRHSLTGKAMENGLWTLDAVNIRDFGEGVHKAVDDTPYGGGAGMVMRADILEKALPANHSKTKKIYLSPRGKPLTQSLVKELSQESALTLLCGRYEGVDQRFLDAYDFEEVSIGDYVLAGGEVAAMVLIEACLRLIPGVLGNAETPDEESFSAATGGLLEYPHYTRPATWTDASGQSWDVPDVLASGHHENIKKWRAEKSLELTKQRRPDLLKQSG